MALTVLVPLVVFARTATEGAIGRACGDALKNQRTKRPSRASKSEGAAAFTTER
jgi:hypothetical protein